MCIHVYRHVCILVCVYCVLYTCICVIVHVHAVECVSESLCSYCTINLIATYIAIASKVLLLVIWKYRSAKIDRSKIPFQQKHIYSYMYI